MCTKFKVANKEIQIYKAQQINAPVVYLNTVQNEGKAVFERCRELKSQDFHLVSISNLRWDHDMSPWRIPPISKSDTPCTGGGRRIS